MAETQQQQLFGDIEEVTLNSKYYPSQQPFLPRVLLQLPKTELKNDTDVNQQLSYFNNLKSVDLETIEIRPQNLISLKYHRLCNGIGNFTLSLFDPNFNKFEEQIIKAGGVLAFRYGYAGNTNDNEVLSPWYTGKVFSYTIDFLMEGSIITFQGITDGIQLVLTRSFSGVSNILISDYIKQIGKDNGWEVENWVEETKPIKSQDGLEFTDYTNKLQNLKAQTILQNIVDELIPYSINTKDEGGYNFFLKKTAEGKTELHYHTPGFKQISKDKNTSKNQTGDKIPTFTLFKNKNNVVKKFTPDWAISIIQFCGGGGTFSAIIDSRTKEISSSTITPANSAQQNLGGTLTKIEAPSTNNTTKTVVFDAKTQTGGTASEQDAKNRASVSSKEIGAIMAKLEIFGTPNFQLLDKIAVIVYIPKGPDSTTEQNLNKHWISGYFQIKEIEDHITPGDFTTYFELFTDKRSTVVKDV